MTNTDRKRSIKISNMMHRSQSYTSLQQLTAAVEQEGPSPTETWSLHKPLVSRHTTTNDALSTTSSSISTGSFTKRFHSSQLGRPPGNISSSTSMNRLNHMQQQKPPKLSTCFSLTTTTTTNGNNNGTATATKIAPMKEVEKMITDLKKENFDLKLRLYHMEDLMNKDLDLYQLNEENNRLKSLLDDRTMYLESLEKEIQTLLLERSNTPTTSCSIGTQTELQGISPTSTLNSYHTASFESSPEAFGLLPVSKPALALQSISNNNKKSNTQKKSDLLSWQKICANEDHISSVVSQLQNFKLVEEENIVDSWLNQTVNNHQQGNLKNPSYSFTK